MAELPSIVDFGEDISNAEAPKPLPVGDYRGEVRSVTVGHSKSSGKLMADVTYYISPDQYPADYTEGNPDGDLNHYYHSCEPTPRNRHLTRKLCEMHGVTTAKEVDFNSFVGTEVILSLTHEEYQGEPRARVRPSRAV